MRERAEELGGTCLFITKPHSGMSAGLLTMPRKDMIYDTLTESTRTNEDT